jgi:hypothetical protein
MKHQWTYHTSHSFKDAKGKQVTMLTQLYTIGVYAIVNGDPAMQMNLRPKDMVKIEKQLKMLEQIGEITELQFGSPITVSDIKGLFERVEN